MRIGVDIGIWGSPGLPGQSVTFDLQLLPRRHEEQDFQFPEHWSSSVSYHPVLPHRLGSSQASQRPPVPGSLALQAELGQVKPMLFTVAISLISMLSYCPPAAGPSHALPCPQELGWPWEG